MRDFVIWRCCAVSIAFGLLTGGIIWLLLAAEARTDRVRVEAAASVAAQHAAWTLGAAHRILRQIDGFIEQYAPVNATSIAGTAEGRAPVSAAIGAWSERLHMAIEQEIRDYPVLRGLLAVDAEGWFVADETNTRARTKLYLGDRDYFRVFADGDLQHQRPSGVFVGAPVVGRRSGKWFFSMSLAVEHGTGESRHFGGVVAGVLDPAFFQAFFDQQRAGRGPELMLVNQHGVVMTAATVDDGQTPLIGQRLLVSDPDGPGLALEGQIGRGAEVVRLTADGPPVLAAVVRIPEYNLLAVATLPTWSGLLPTWSPVMVGGLGLWLVVTAAAAGFFLREARFRRLLLEQCTQSAASERECRLIYQNAPMMFHAIDGSGRLVAVSRYWLCCLGYQEQEVIGRPLMEFLSLASGRVLRDMMQFEFYTNGMVQDIPFQYIARDGTMREVLLSANGERDPDGRLVRSLAVSIDVSDQRRAERSVHDLLDATADFMIELTPDQHILRCQGNDSSGLFSGDSPLAGRALADVVGEKYIEPFAAAHREAVARGGLQVFELELAAPDDATGYGNNSSYEVRMVPIEGGGALAVVREISGRRRAEQRFKTLKRRLAQANADLDAFAFLASHDLRAALGAVRHLLATPGVTVHIPPHPVLADVPVSLKNSVAAMGGCERVPPGRGVEGGPRAAPGLLTAVPAAGADLVRGEGQIEEKSREGDGAVALGNRRHLSDRVARLERQLEDFFGYVRAARMVQAAEVVEVGELVHAIAGGNDLPVGFRVVPAKDLPRLITPPAPFEQVMRHLIINVVDHHDRGVGTITVDWRDRGALVELIVRDDGPGIPAVWHERVFQLFQTVPRAAPAGGRGSGVGLAIVRRLVETWGGRVWIESDPEVRRGTSVHFEWRRVARHEEPEGRIEAVTAGREGDVNNY